LIGIFTGKAQASKSRQDKTGNHYLVAHIW